MDKPTDLELLKQGLEHVDNALSFIMEMETDSGKALSHFLHAVLTLGETVIESVDAQ